MNLSYLCYNLSMYISISKKENDNVENAFMRVI